MSEIKLKPLLNSEQDINNELLLDSNLNKNDLSFLNRTKKINISVALDEDIIKQLKLFAKKHKATRSISKIVQKAVSDFLAKNL